MQAVCIDERENWLVGNVKEGVIDTIENQAAMDVNNLMQNKLLVTRRQCALLDRIDT